MRDAFAFYLWIGNGSLDEPKGLRGLSHLAEHMVFRARNPVTKIPYINQIYAKKVKINAYTSLTYTVFILHGENSRDPEVLNALKQMLQKPFFLPEDLIQEKKVILNEIKESTGPLKQSLLNVKSKIFPSYWGYDLLGDQKVIADLTLEDVYGYFKKTFGLKKSSAGRRSLLPRKLPFFHHDREHHFFHVVYEVKNLKTYASLLLLQSILQRLGISVHTVYNQSVSLVFISSFGRDAVSRLQDVLRDLTVFQFLSARQEIEWVFIKNFFTGNDEFQINEWKHDLGGKVSYRQFQLLLHLLNFDDFMGALNEMVKGSGNKALSHKNLPLKKWQPDLHGGDFFCFSLVLKYGSMNEKKTETGFTYVLSELLEFRLDQLMGNEKNRITSDHSYNHYGVTIMGLGDSTKISKKITDFFRKLEFSEQEKELFTALLNDKMNRLRKLEKFEIECDKIYFKKLKLNWQRYPEQPMTLAKLESFLVKHKSLVTTSLLSSLKRKNVGPQKTRSTPIGLRKVFINRQSSDSDAVEYLIYIPLPQVYASIDNLLNVSAYVTREEFTLFNDLKYKAGLFYHFRVKVMKVEGAVYLKIKFTSALTNRAFITKYIQNFDLEKELVKSKGYYQKTHDPISLNREKLLRMILG